MNEIKFLPKSSLKSQCCPHCQSTEGYRIGYLLVANGADDYNFDGDLLNSVLTPVDKTETGKICLTCGKPMNIKNPKPYYDNQRY